MKQFNTLREETLEEKLKASDPAGTYIHDFVHSDNPKFTGKSKAKRIQMALAASYAAKGKSRNEEIEVEEGVMDTVKTVASKVGKALTGGSDQDQLKNLQKKMGLPQTGKKPTTEEKELGEVNMTAHIKRQATRLKIKAGGLKTTNTTMQARPRPTMEGSTQDVADTSMTIVSKGINKLNKAMSGKDPSSLVGTQTK